MCFNIWYLNTDKIAMQQHWAQGICHGNLQYVDKDTDMYTKNMYNLNYTNIHICNSALLFPEIS